MCGIVGCIDRKNNVDARIINTMMDILKHRGPDDKGYEQFEIAGCNFGMGFIRLSIRDLSEAGHQPMFNKDGDIVITLNGEIYNADELRQPLIDAGYTFKSTSDTEVLLDLYELYGIDKMLPMLDGMYAVCIVDKRADCIYLIRDRLGEKPLYIWDNGDTFLYASEYKAFYCHPVFKAELNEEAIDEYFLFRYVSYGDTMLKGVKNLRPGSYLKIDAEGVHQTTYWELPSATPNSMNYEANKHKYEELLKKSMRRRLISDRKVGLQLSGGVDSSYMAHIAQPMLDERLHTFSIIFEDKKYSEEQYQEQVIKQEKCEPHNFVYSSQMFFDCWRECTWYFEAPMNHEGTLGLLYLNRRSKDFVTVMLCGEGSDETLGGYTRFFSEAQMLKGWWPLRLVINQAKEFIHTKHLPNYFSKEAAVIHSTQYVSDDMFCRLRSGGRKAIRKVYNKRLLLLNKAKSNDGTLRSLMNYEIQTYMQDLLMRADKTSMASSIEVRVPFIMPEIVEFASTIPDKYLVDTSKDVKHGTKVIIKDLCADVYGENFTYRNKMGFSAPVLRYFCAPEVSDYIDCVIMPGIKQRGVVDYKEVQKMWAICKESNGNDYEHQWPLWCAFSFELWAQMFLDNNPATWKHVVF
jgi:asparagine synthase (glutamine-hydrolysing)